MAKSKSFNIEGTEIRITQVVDSLDDFICLTDIAKQVDRRSEIVIQNWIRNAGTLDFLKEWELLYNPDFNHIEFDVFRKSAGRPAFVMTPSQWVTRTNAIGINSKKGRYGGTYAHKDIAFEFCSAISARFKLILIKEFQRLKEDEAKRLGNPWSIKREISKANYHILTETIKDHLIPDQIAHTKKQGIYFASEADLLNQVLYGMTAKQWKNANPKAKGNIRDNSTVLDLVILANLEALNSQLIQWDCDQEQRFQLLKESEKDFRTKLSKSKALDRIKNNIQQQNKLLE